MKKELSDFLKIAYEHGKIKELRDAFEEFPVEEEWHKGKLENVLKEDSKSYMLYEIGDIVFVREYIYSDGKIGNTGIQGKYLYCICTGKYRKSKKAGVVVRFLWDDGTCAASGKIYLRDGSDRFDWRSEEDQWL